MPDPVLGTGDSEVNENLAIMANIIIESFDQSIHLCVGSSPAWPPSESSSDPDGP